MTRSKSANSAGNKQLLRYELPPIADPHREKRRIERYPSRWLADLFAKGKPRGLGVSMEVFSERAIEVYRLCYEQSVESARYKVLQDFAAHQPHLLFEARWVRNEIRATCCAGTEAGNAREKTFRAIGNGFRSAGTAKSYERSLQKLAINAGRIIQQRLKAELTEWNKSLQRTVALPEFLRESATLKVEELVIKYPRLNDRRNKQRLLQLLQIGRIYEASVLIAARTVRVRERSLQEK